MTNRGRDHSRDCRADAANTAPYGAPARPDILTADEVAGMLKVKRRQVQRLCIPCLGLGRKTKRYLLVDVLDWLKERRRDTGEPRE